MEAPLSANYPTEPLSPNAARFARHIVSHPERFLHLPAQAREALYARQWQVLHHARRQPSFRLITGGEGGAA